MPTKDIGRVLNIGELAQTQPKDAEYVVDPLVRRGRTTILAGQPKAGKSLVALALAQAVLHGDDVAGFSCESGNVLYVDAENGPDDVHERVYAFGFEAAAHLTYMDVRGDGFNLERHIMKLNKWVRDAKADFVVLDSLRSLWPGKVSSNEDTTAALLPLADLAEQNECGILILHHTTKRGNSYSGANALVSAVSHGMALLKKPEKASDPMVRCVEYEDLRSRSAPDLQYLRIVTENGSLAIEEAVASSGPDAKSALKTVKEGIYGSLSGKHNVDATVDYERQQSNGWVPQHMLITALGRPAKDQSSRRAFRLLEGEGLIEQKRDGNTVLWRNKGVKVSGANGNTAQNVDTLTPSEES